MEENTNPTQSVPTTPNPQPAISQQPTPNPIKPASKFSLRVIIGMIIFLILAGCAAASYVYRKPIMKLVSKPTPTPRIKVSPTPTPDPTADWKTYTPSGVPSYNFTFKYPPTYNLTGTEEFMFILEKDNPNYNQTGKVDGAIISGKLLGGNFSESDFEKNYSGDISFLGASTISGHQTLTGKLTSGNVHVVWIDTGALQPGQLSHILELELGIGNNVSAEKLQEYSTAFSQILSTFKFTQISPNPTQSMQTETYVGNGFTFQLPSGYKIDTKTLNKVTFIETVHGFGGATLEWQNNPFPEPTTNNQTVEKQTVQLDGKQAVKYTTASTNTESNINEFVTFTANNTFYKLTVHVDAGGVSVDKFTSTFRFTN